MSAVPSTLLAPGPAQGTRQMLPGLLLCAGIAWIALNVSQHAWAQQHGLSALTISILLGMVLGNTAYPSMAIWAGPGVGFTKQRLLRLGIILYGLKITFQDVADVGWSGIAIDAAVLTSTFVLAWWMGTRVFGLDRSMALLIGAGSSICGAAAVMATEPVVRGRSQDVAVAISTVVVFGTIAMFLYPTIYKLNLIYNWITLDAHGYGVFVGSTLHEVAQVVVAGRSISPEAANTAVIAKMVRVMMLAPLLITLSAVIARPSDSSGGKIKTVVIPWFAVLFFVMAGIHSSGLIPKQAVDVALEVDTFLLAMAMAALGLTTHVSAVKRAGVRPLLLAAVLFVWLMVGGFVINRILA